MKKRLLSLFLALCLLASLLPAAVLAAEPVIDLDQVKLDKLLGEASLVDENNSAYSYENPLPAGSYRLTGDVVLMASIVIKGNVTLDLNGQKIERDNNALCGAIRVVGADASLTLTDSSEEQSGAIDTFHAGDAIRLGGGVYVDGGTFVIPRGTPRAANGQRPAASPTVRTPKPLSPASSWPPSCAGSSGKISIITPPDGTVRGLYLLCIQDRHQILPCERAAAEELLQQLQIVRRMLYFLAVETDDRRKRLHIRRVCRQLAQAQQVERAAEHPRGKLPVIDGLERVPEQEIDQQLPELSQSRVDGYMAALDELGVKYEIVANQDAWLQDMGIEVVGGIITANPDLDVILAMNDGGTIGSAMAVVNAGKSDDIMVFGHDGSDQISSMVLDESNPLQAVVAQDPYTQGYKAIEGLVNAIRTGKVEERGVSTVVPGTVLSITEPDAVNAWRAAQGY